MGNILQKKRLQNGYKYEGGRGSPNYHRSILLSIHARIKFFTIAILGENSKKTQGLDEALLRAVI
ncbi:MAG: hypothetical protein VX855_08200, partial [Verrucomicrobiota bacterium]|nr:hypothetical protein [Verrucomicrobiota bacterium]